MSKRKTAVKYRDISWGEVFYEILIKWRLLIILLVAGAIVGALGGYFYDKTTYAKKLAKYEKYLAESEGNAENAELIASYDAMSVLELYNSMPPSYVNDVYVALDAAATFDKLYASKIRQFNNLRYCYEMSFCYSIEDDSFKNDLLTYVVKQINDGYWVAYMENLQFDTRNYRENVYAFRGYDSEIQDSESNVITIYMWFESPDDYTAIKGYFIGFLSSISDFYTSQGKNNSFRVINDNRSTGASQYFMNLKYDYDSRCKDALSTLSFYRNTFEMRQQVLYNKLTYVWTFDLENYTPPTMTSDGLLIEEEQKVVKSTVSKPKTPSISPLYLAGGAIGLPVIFSILVFFVYLFSDKLHLSDDTVELFDQYTYGRIAVANNRKFGSKLDKAISKLRLGAKKSFDKEKAVSMIEAGIKLSLADRTNSGSITFIGCDMSEQVLAMLQNIADDLAKENINVKIANNVLYDPQALLTIKNSQNVILAETCNKTSYSEIIDELDLVEHENIPKLGMIVFE